MRDDPEGHRLIAPTLRGEPGNHFSFFGVRERVGELG